MTQKLVPSRVANAIIFAIDEQYSLKFETTLFIDCKNYIIFLFRGTCLLFFLYFLFLLFLAFFRLSFLLSNHISLSFLHSPASTTENHGGSGSAKPWRRWGQVCGLWVSAADRGGWVAVVRRAWLGFDKCGWVWVGFVIWFWVRNFKNMLFLILGLWYLTWVCDLWWYWVWLVVLMLVCWVFDLVLGGGNTDLQRLWVSPVMVAMAVLGWFVVGFVWWVCGWWVCGGCWLLGEVAIGC